MQISKIRTTYVLQNIEHKQMVYCYILHIDTSVPNTSKLMIKSITGEYACKDNHKC